MQANPIALPEGTLVVGTLQASITSIMLPHLGVWQVSQAKSRVSLHCLLQLSWLVALIMALPSWLEFPVLVHLFQLQ